MMTPSFPSSPSGSAKDDALTLRVCALGFAASDMNLITGVATLSRRRNPHIELVEQGEAARADVFLVDGSNPDALRWVEANAWIRRKCVIWVRASALAGADEMVLRPPVLWSQLPFTIARALEEKKQSEKAAARSGQGNDSFGVLTGFWDDALSEQDMRHKILVVDDSSTVRQHLRTLLEGYKLDVTEAATGDAAIAAMSSFIYDCVLLDVLMPGMDGYETCRKLKAVAKSRGRNTAVVMLTSKGSPFDRIRGKMSGCDAYLTKPVQLADLLKELSKYVKLLS